MKKIYFILLLSAVTIGCMAQNIGEAFYIYRNDGEFNAFFRDEVLSIEYSNYDLDSVYHDDVVVQDVYTQDSIYRIPLAAIDSVSFSQPVPIYKENVRELSGPILDYIISVDGLSIKLKKDVPLDLKPNLGDKLVKLYFTDLFPDGFVGQVSNVTIDNEGINVICDSIAIEDAVKRFYAVYRVTSIVDTASAPSRRSAKQENSNGSFNKQLLWGRIPLHIGYDYVNVLHKVLTPNEGQGGVKTDIMIYAEPTINITLTFACDEYIDLIPKYNIHIGTSLDLEEEIKLAGALSGETKISLIPDNLSHLKNIPIAPGFNGYFDGGFKLSGSGELGLDIQASQSFYDIKDFDIYPTVLNPIPGLFGTVGPLTIQKTNVLRCLGTKFEWKNIYGKLEVKTGPYIEFGFSFIDHRIVKFGAEIDLGVHVTANMKHNLDEWDKSDLDTTYYSNIKDNSKVDCNFYAGAYLFLAFFEKINLFGETSGKSHRYMVGDEVDLGELFRHEAFLMPSFENVRLLRNNNTNSLTAFADIDRVCLFPMSVGFSLFNSKNEFVKHATFEENKYQTPESMRFYNVGFTGIDTEEQYRVYPTVRFLDKDVLATPFATEKIPVSIINVQQTSAQYSKAAFEYKGKKYDFCYSASVTASITSTNNVEDWGYVYEDLNGDTAHVSLKAFGSPYTDTRYSYYRNEPESYATLYGYVKYVGDDNFYHGEKTDYPLIYDKQPEAITLEPTMIEETSAKVMCKYKEAAPWGGTCGVEYWEDLNINNTKKIYFDTAEEEIEITLTDLKPGTDYYYQAFIMIGDEYIMDETEDGIKSFTTKPHVVVTTGNVTNVQTSSATLTGTVENYDPTDESVILSFKYSTDADVLNSASGTSVVATFDGEGGVTANIAGLKEYTTYYYTLTVKRGDGDLESSVVKSFRTNPVVTTLENPTANSNSVTLYGSCSKGITVAGFAVRKNGSSSYTQYGASVDEDGNFSATIDGLDALTAYSYFAFVHVDDKSFSGAECHFSTTQPPVTYNTGDATSVSATTAILNGTVNYYDPNDESVKFKFFYHTDANVFNGKSVAPTYDGNASMTASVSDLEDYTTYFYALAVKQGEGEYISHNVSSFKTLPVVVTLDNATATSNSVALSGTCSKGITVAGFAVRKNGSSSYTQYGASVDEDGYFSATIDGLDAATTYSYYGFVKADNQTFVGETLTFTTEQPQLNLCPDENHPHLIDLGLPSGTKWACCNVGASKPEEYGEYYAWGETEEKSDYRIGTYKYAMMDNTYGTYKDYVTQQFYSCIYISSEISGTSYDVARVKCGDSFRMPTIEEYKELFQYPNCSFKSIQHNGVNGHLITGSNGNSIFLPYAGHYFGSELLHDMDCYWSGSLCYYDSNGAGGLLFARYPTLPEGVANPEWFYCNGLANGCPVRPVQKGMTITTDGVTEIKTTSVKLNGTIVDGYQADENITLVFLYSTNEDVLNSNDCKTVIANRDADGNLTAEITNLDNLTTYYYSAAYKQDDANYVLGGVRSFNISKYISIDTEEVNGNYIYCAAKLKGICHKKVEGATYGFAVKKDGDSSYTEHISSSVYTSLDNDYSSFNMTVENLNAETKYYYYAFTQINGVTYMGDEKTFTTPKNPCPDNHHPHLIDLGLPSGTKWACCNIGATKPEECGDYYAWGEIEEKDNYTHLTYKFYTGDPTYWFADIGSEISGTSNDVAHVKWGIPYRMPSKDDYQELMNNTVNKRNWFKLSDTEGMVFTGPNGNQIFLPATGSREYESIGAKNSCYYWTGTYINNPNFQPTQNAYKFFCRENYIKIMEHFRGYGLPVRPVCK